MDLGTAGQLDQGEKLAASIFGKARTTRLVHLQEVNISILPGYFQDTSRMLPDRIKM
jgi:hypothetical protein